MMESKDVVEHSDQPQFILYVFFLLPHICFQTIVHKIKLHRCRNMYTMHVNFIGLLRLLTPKRSPRGFLAHKLVDGLHISFVALIMKL